MIMAKLEGQKIHWSHRLWLREALVKIRKKGTWMLYLKVGLVRTPFIPCTGFNDGDFFFSCDEIVMLLFYNDAMSIIFRHRRWYDYFPQTIDANYFVMFFSIVKVSWGCSRFLRGFGDFLWVFGDFWCIFEGVWRFWGGFERFLRCFGGFWEFSRWTSPSLWLFFLNLQGRLIYEVFFEMINNR